MKRDLKPIAAILLVSIQQTRDKFNPSPLPLPSSSFLSYGVVNPLLCRFGEMENQTVEHGLLHALVKYTIQLALQNVFSYTRYNRVLWALHRQAIAGKPPSTCVTLPAGQGQVDRRHGHITGLAGGLW